MQRIYALVLLLLTIPMLGQPAAEPEIMEKLPPDEEAAADLRLLEKQLAAALEDNREQIHALHQKIADIQQEAPSLQKLGERIDLLEKMNNQRQSNERRVDEIRFEAAKTVLLHLIDETNDLKGATQLARALTTYQATLNPMNDPAFSNEILQIRGTVRRNHARLFEAANASGLMTNPYVSLALTVVSVLEANYSPSDKVARLQNVMCVAGLTSRLSTDGQYVENTIRVLDEHVRKLNDDLKLQFIRYAAAVHYTVVDWKKYQEVKKATGVDPLSQATSKFFAELPPPSLGGSLPEDLVPLRYQVENVKLQVAEYERLLQEIDGFYSAFARTIEKNAAAAPIDAAQCDSSTSVSSIRSRLTELLPMIRDGHQAFREAVNPTIPDEGRRILFTEN